MRELPDSVELARLASLDLGKDVTSDHIRAYLLIGLKGLTAAGFDLEDAEEIQATVLKEMS
jgi:hypothetical protein